MMATPMAKSPKKSPKPHEGERDITGIPLSEIAFDAAHAGEHSFSVLGSAGRQSWEVVVAALAAAVRRGVRGAALAKAGFAAALPGTDMVFERLDPANRAIWDNAAGAIGEAVARKDAAQRRKAA